MKYLLFIAMFSLVSSVAMADGFRCSGEGFRVKMYNQVQPELGTKNPAVLVVFEKGAGTLATLYGEEIEAEYSSDTLVYGGQTNGKLDGRFVHVNLEIEKQPSEDGKTHAARLTVAENGLRRIAYLACARYLKGER